MVLEGLVGVVLVLWVGVMGWYWRVVELVGVFLPNICYSFVRLELLRSISYKPSTVHVNFTLFFLLPPSSCYHITKEKENLSFLFLSVNAKDEEVTSVQADVI